jgi:hypothetical protein
MINVETPLKIVSDNEKKQRSIQLLRMYHYARRFANTSDLDGDAYAAEISY